MKAVLLVRVSTASQDYEAQKNELIDYAHKQGYDELKVIEDKESAIKLSEEERHGLNEMKEYLTENQDCKMVMVWELSRLARTEKVLHSVKDWLVTRKINLHVLSENITLLDKDGNEIPTSSLMFTFFGHICSQEMTVKKARIERGRKENAEKGKHSGKMIKFGYTVDKNNYVILNKEEADVVKNIYTMYASGKYTIKSLQKELNELGYDWSYNKVCKILSDVSYNGEASKRNKYFHHYPKLIDDELFNKVQEIKKQNMQEKSKESVNKRLALKILRCHVCGYAYGFFTNAKNNQEIYICNHRKYYKQLGVEKCESVQINADIVDKILTYVAQNEEIEYLSKMNEYTTIEIEKEIEVLDRKIVASRNEIIQLSEEKDRVNKMFEKGRITEEKYDEKFDEIDAREVNFNTRISTYQEDKDRKQKILNDIESNTLANYIEKAQNIMNAALDKDKLYDIVRERIKSAYVDGLVVNGRHIKVICVITTTSKLLTFINDVYASKKCCNLIELTDEGYNDFSQNESILKWTNVTEDMKEMVIENSKWIKEQMKDNFKSVRKAIQPFQDKVMNL